MKFIILMIFLAFLLNTPLTFALDNQSNAQIGKIQEEVSELKKKIDQKDWEMYASISGIAVALLGVFLSNHQTRKSNKISKDAYDNARKATEADLLLRLNDNIYRSEEGKKIIEQTRLNLPILRNNAGGTVSERELETFLNEVESVAMLIGQGTLTSALAEQAFGWVIMIIKNNQEITDYIKKAQEKYGDYAWIEITNYTPNPNFKRSSESPSQLPDKKIKLSELRIARIQIWSSTITALGAVAFGLGAAMWVAAGSALASVDPTKTSSFLLSLVNVFNNLSPIFTILGIIAILFGFLFPMYLLRENQG